MKTELFLISGAILVGLFILWMKVKQAASFSVKELDSAIRSLLERKKVTEEELNATLKNLDDSLDTLNKLRRERGEEELGKRS